MIATPMVTVTEGRTVLGFVIARGKTGHQAYTADQRDLGLFETRVAAANAVADAAVTTEPAP